VFVPLDSKFNNELTVFQRLYADHEDRMVSKILEGVGVERRLSEHEKTSTKKSSPKIPRVYNLGMFKVIIYINIICY
jgi:hypothetical protein